MYRIIKSLDTESDIRYHNVFRSPNRAVIRPDTGYFFGYPARYLENGFQKKNSKEKIAKNKK